MKDTILTTRRRLLASMPAAAAMAPAAATALPGLATAIPDYLDGQTVRGLTEALNHLDKLPKGEANKVLTAIKESIECSMRNHAHDAPLMALKPQFDEVFEDWWKRKEASKLDLDDCPPRSDEEVDRGADQFYELIDKILSHSPITREGLALQCRALIMDGFDDWNDRTARFVGNMVLFFNWKLPDTLAVELLTWGQHWDDEDEEEEGEGKDEA
jgi:hypothetical protein